MPLDCCHTLSLGVDRVAVPTVAGERHTHRCERIARARAANVWCVMVEKKTLSLSVSIYLSRSLYSLLSHVEILISAHQSLILNTAWRINLMAHPLGYTWVIHDIPPYSIIPTPQHRPTIRSPPTHTWSYLYSMITVHNTHHQPNKPISYIPNYVYIYIESTPTNTARTSHKYQLIHPHIE